MIRNEKVKVPKVWNGCCSDDKVCSICGKKIRSGYQCNTLSDLTGTVSIFTLCDDCYEEEKKSKTNVHFFKIFTEEFGYLKSGRRKFEIRDIRGDDYNLGDIVVYEEFDYFSNSYTGNTLRKKISDIVTDDRLIKRGCAIIGLCDV